MFIKVKKRHIKCLKANVKLFVVSPDEIPDIDSSVACHHLNIDPFVRYVARQRRRQSLEKAEVTRKTNQDLTDAKFIFEVRYIEWLSNVMLVKKTIGK